MNKFFRQKKGIVRDYGKKIDCVIDLDLLQKTKLSLNKIVDVRKTNYKKATSQLNKKGVDNGLAIDLGKPLDNGKPLDFGI